MTKKNKFIEELKSNMGLEKIKVNLGLGFGVTVIGVSLGLVGITGIKTYQKPHYRRIF